MFVEITRLLIVLVATAAGWSLGSAWTHSHGEAPVVGAAIGAAVGYVVGGIVARLATVAAGRAEERLRRTSAARLLVGAFGMVAGGGLAAVGTLPAGVLLPRPVGWALYGLATWLGAWIGWRVAAGRAEDLLARLGLALLPGPAAGPVDPGAAVLDTSAVLDGRLLALCRVGFLRGPLLLPRFVLDELQGVADAPDAVRRRRGRRGLEVLAALDRQARVTLRVLEDDFPELSEVDAKLVAVARRYGALLVTVDAPLRRVAELQGVRCLHLEDLAAGLRSAHVPGETLALPIAKPGREAGQGVGYLDDGTMVVVGGAADLVGREVQVQVTSNVQTSQGRLLFASLVASP